MIQKLFIASVELNDGLTIPAKSVRKWRKATRFA